MKKELIASTFLEVSRAFAKIFAIIFVVVRLIVRRVRRMEYRAAGRKNAGRTRTFSSGGEQRVTRGSILYRGRGPPLVTAVFSLGARPLPFAANGSGGHAEA